MSEYSDYCLDLKLLSPVATPWQSDTIMGHLAWCVAMTEGVSALKSFLEPFVARDPPFVISDGFPAGLLPQPFFLSERPMPQAMSVQEYAKMKRMKKASFVSVEDFDALRRGSDPIHVRHVESPWTTFEMLHAVIDRTTWSTEGEGNIFSSTSQALAQTPPVLSIYVRARDDVIDLVEVLFRQLSRIGFGKDKSTGKGQFEVAGLSKWDLFNNIESADGFASLSTWVPASSDPVQGFWKLQVKRGKLGEGAGHGNPFKLPVVQLLPGSSFHTRGHPAPWYGRSVSDIAPAMPEAVQLCFCLAVPCRFPSVPKG